MKIGEIILSKRKQNGMSQEELGNEIGVTRQTISNWELGETSPNVEQLKILSKVLKIDFNEIFNNRGNTLPVVKKYKIDTIILLIIAIIIIGLVFLINNKNNYNVNKYNCSMIKTYNIVNISDSNDENYSYVTLREYQSEGVYSVKLPKTISKNLIEANNYEFTFNINKENVYSTPSEIFEKAKLININHSDKIGNEQVNEFHCN